MTLRGIAPGSSISVPVTVPNGGTGLTSGTSGAVLYFDSTTTMASSALLAAGGVVFGGGAGAAPETDAGLTYAKSTDALTTGTLAVTGTTVPAIGIFARAAGALTFSPSSFQRMELSNSILQFGSGVELGWSSGNIPTASDIYVARAGAANSVRFGSANQATTNSETTIRKPVTAIADNTATAVLTVTIPNSEQRASIRIRLQGSLGAGGAIGSGESTQDAEYMINVARTAGVNAVATIGAVVGQAAAASVAGANNAATTATLSAISGAVGATNTFTINVTIAKSGGASANHTCLAYAELLNTLASGVTIA